MPIFQSSSLVSGVAVTFNCTTPVPTNITGWTLVAYFGPGGSSTSPGGPATLILDNGSRGGIAITAALTGGFTVALTHAQHESLGPGQITMSVWRLDSGFEDCLLQTVITLKPDPSVF